MIHITQQKILLSEIGYYFQDIDGNFIKEFQSKNGFDARIWELYLFCFLSEQGFEFHRKKNFPDFIIDKDGLKIAIEATILARNIQEASDFSKLFQFSKNDISLKYSSSLNSKLRAKYWNSLENSEKPFIIAIADFYEDFSMTFSSFLLIEYLFGIRFNYIKNNLGKLENSVIENRYFEKKNGCHIDSGFFSLPDSDNVSAILISSIATVNKFNRIGIQSGFVNSKIDINRFGFKHDNENSAVIPKFFCNKVDESCSETWSEGVMIIHNPNAKFKIPKTLFNFVAHIEFINGEIVCQMPSFFPYNSINLQIEIQNQNYEKSI
jgi:hypothetical protein